MIRRSLSRMALWLVIGGTALVAAGQSRPASSPRVSISFGPELSSTAIDGRVLLLVSSKEGAEPRFQLSDGPDTQLVFGIDVEGLRPGAEAVIDQGATGYPLDSIASIPAGTYTVQGFIDRYETFTRSDGFTVKLPMDRGEGRQWNRSPGNLYSTPRKIVWDPAKNETVRIALDKAIAPIPDPPETKYIKHLKIQSERLTKFWGRPMYLGAHVLLPEGFTEHPEARYPLVINHGHFPYTLEGFREEPPDPSLTCERSERFNLDCYNRTEQEEAYRFYKLWTGPSFPRFLIVEIQHANPYYDDSYAVNSANLGPYGDAITYELVPHIEKTFRGIGQGWARFMYGGSTGGWEALGAQIMYPDEYNGCYAACPDPIDFRAYTSFDIYKDANAYFLESRWKQTPRPGHRNYLGHVSSTVEDMNRHELAIATRGRSGGQWDIWQAVYSPVGKDGYPAPIFDKRSGVIDRKVAEYWRENYDLSYILRRDWDKGLGKKLQGKIHIYVGDMDNYYLNNAVYLVEEFLKGTKNPSYDGVVDYGDRFEHCWNGAHDLPNAISRLRYHELFAPRILDRILKSAPAGADVKSWRY